MVSLVVAVVVVLLAFVSVAALFSARGELPVEPRALSFGPFEVVVSTQVPDWDFLLLVGLSLVLVAAVAIALEITATLLTVNPDREVLDELRGDTADPATCPDIRITILVPAHNEEASLPVTLGALAQQTRQPDRVIVVADNCTDRTPQIAEEMGYEVFRSVNNADKKAGALNQALTRILPESEVCDVFMVMDADTSLAPRFLEVGAQRFRADPELSSVGGVFYGEGGSGLLGQFQRNEYTRYSLQIRARHGRVFVLTGTASMFRSQALLDVAAARGVIIPGGTGQVYDTEALTEDNELTLALKSLGGSMTSPAECQVTTEIMPTWRNLWVQRKRWQRGALENLSEYGITRATVRYWGQQFGIAYGTIALNLFLLLMFITIVAVDQWIWFPFWLAVGLVFVVERVATVWRGGWRARILAAVLVPELGYDLFLQAVFVKCLFDISMAKRTTWGHVEHGPGAGA
ncbi:MAG: glycosyltransferase family 2 protein [Actinobacteria bacterium]|nr:glycosyltransferase family 2 protein [Actinomycetota bacterium]